MQAEVCLSLSVFRQLSSGHVLMELPITSVTLLLETVKGEPAMCSRLLLCFHVYVILSAYGCIVNIWEKDKIYKVQGVYC